MDVATGTIDRFDISQSPADLNLYEGDWKNYYAGVYRCNELIAHEEQIVWNESDSKRGIYMGECRTLRALLYLDMVRLWGNIPLFLEPVNENRAPSPAKEVFSAIFTDLKYAIENIPGDAYPGLPTIPRTTDILQNMPPRLCWHVPIFSIPDITVKNLQR